MGSIIEGRKQIKTLVSEQRNEEWNDGVDICTGQRIIEFV